MDDPIEPIKNPEKPKNRRGQTREYLAEISKKGNEVKKMKGAITAYEKAQKKKEIEEKFAMIQAELEKTKLKETEPRIIAPKQSNDTDDIQQQPIVEQRPPPIKTKKPKKIVEVIEVEDETDDDEEEVIVKRIIKKKQVKKIKEDKEDFIKQTNMEMLKNKFNEDIKRRIASSLFDD